MRDFGGPEPVSTTEGAEQIHPRKWINSAIRQKRNSCVGTFLSSSLLPEKDQSSNYFYISSRTVQGERALLSAPSFLEEKCLSFFPDLQGSCSMHTLWRKPEQEREWDSI